MPKRTDLDRPLRHFHGARSRLQTFSARARPVWRSIVIEYPARHFRGANLILLETFCRARAFVSECDKHIEQHGLLIDGKRNPVVAMRAVG